MTEKKPRLPLKPGWIYFQDAIDTFGIPKSSLHDYVGLLDAKHRGTDPNGLKTVEAEPLKKLLRKKGKLKK